MALVFRIQGESFPVPSGPTSPSWGSAVNLTFVQGLAEQKTVRLNDPSNVVAEEVYWLGGTLPDGITILDPGGPGTRDIVVDYDGVGVIASASGTLAATDGSYLDVLPDWNDENAAYNTRPGVTVNVGTKTDFESSHTQNQIDNFGGWTGYGGVNPQDEMHDGSEGDEMWCAYHMWKRLEGQRPHTMWQTRATNLRDYFRDTYLGQLQAGGNETGNNYDHLYGWGLCDYFATEGGAGIVTTVNNIVTEMDAWADGFGGGKNPGDHIMDTASGGRRWGRQLQFATAAYSISATVANQAWRDRVVGLVLQNPSYDATWGAHFMTNDNNLTDNRGFDYASGDRIINSFHTGQMFEGLWRAWKQAAREGTKEQTALRTMLIEMATFIRDNAQTNDEGNWKDGNIARWFGVNINTSARIHDDSYGGQGLGAAPDGVYSIPPVNGLVYAYKLTGDVSFYNKAWELYLEWQGIVSGTANEIEHFVSTRLSGQTAQGYNNGELQYTWALWEEGGSPTLL